MLFQKISMIIYGNCCCFIWNWHKRLGFGDSVTFAWHASRITLSPEGCELHSGGWHSLRLTFWAWYQFNLILTLRIETAFLQVGMAFVLVSSFVHCLNGNSSSELHSCALIWQSEYFLKHCDPIYAPCSQDNLLFRYTVTIPTIWILFICPCSMYTN